MNSGSVFGTQILSNILCFFLGLLNLRGSDIDYNPVFFAYCVVTHENVFLFIDEKKLTEAVYKHFTQEGISVTVKPVSYTHLTLPTKRIV